ncbi:MAG TPA: ATP-dependent RNA helicase RhlB, partial [Pseudomonas sp.]|nr:ATP-dependent RNA helicase RhlB [Pseudomonas sp.]
MLKALKKMFGKGSNQPATTEAESSTSIHQGASDPAYFEKTRTQQDDAPKASPKPRRERASKPAAPLAPVWKLEDFAVEPAEGKTRFHDFKLAPELMHAIHDLGFPYCTPIQAQVLGFTLKGRDAIGRAQTGTG